MVIVLEVYPELPKNWHDIESGIVPDVSIAVVPQSRPDVLVAHMALDLVEGCPFGKCDSHTGVAKRMSVGSVGETGQVGAVLHDFVDRGRR